MIAEWENIVINWHSLNKYFGLNKDAHVMWIKTIQSLDTEEHIKIKLLDVEFVTQSLISIHH